jgi:PAS domain S-box-containing protein
VSGATDSYRAARRYRTRSGDVRDVDLNVSLVRDAAGAPELILAVLQDTTEHQRALDDVARHAAQLEAVVEQSRQTEEALRLSEARYRALVEQAPLSIQILSPEGKTLQVNAAWQRLWGLELEQMTGYNMLEDRQLEERGLMPFIRRGFGGEPAQIPAALYDPDQTIPDGSSRDDSRRWVRGTIYPLKDAQGRVREVVLIHEDITEQVRSDEQRREATELLLLLVQQSGEAIVVADATGVVRIFNPAAERLYGVPGMATSPEQWADHYRLLRTDGTPLPYDETALYRAVHGQTIRDARWLVPKEDGTTRLLVGSSAPLRTSDGEPAGAVLIARDETDRLAAEAERERLLVESQRAHREVQAASRLKDEFLATLSHELRTPLNAVLGWARILLMRETDPATAKALEVIERNALAQARLIDDLLDVSRIITGKIALQIDQVDLAAAVTAALETVRPAADARGVRLDADIPAALPRITGDGPRLQQVLWNLLSNAVKFTDSGGRITVSLLHDQRSVRITVSDTGIGIAPEILPYVFDRFTQGDASSTRAHPGLGLGLAIVRHLVELHGGTTSAESAGPAKGATFRVWLPIAPSDPENPSLF